MTEKASSVAASLLAPMLKKPLFVAINRLAVPGDTIRPNVVAKHLAYMNALEDQGRLWASGPFVEDGVLVGDGLTILSVDTLEEARELMESEPLVRRRLRTFELRKWELREGRMDISLRASLSRYSL